MNKKMGSGEQTKEEKGEGIRAKAIPLLTLLLVIAVSIGLFYYYGRAPERFAELQNYGYLGAFLISLIGNGTILLHAAVLPILCTISVIVYPATGPIGPVLVGLVGGVGAGIGEISGYMVGYSGRGVIRNNKLYLRFVAWVRRWGVLAVFVFSLVPFFFDLAGIAAGVLRLPLWKFVTACWLGRSINYVFTCLVVAVWGGEALLRFFG